MTVVVRLPLEGLSHPDGVQLTRRTRLARDDIRPMLRFGSDVDLVVSTIGEPLRWRRDDAMREFWHSDAVVRIAEPDSPVDLEVFPGERCYLAYLWSDDDDDHRTIELQEMH